MNKSKGILVFVIAVGLVCAGCATTGQSTGLGALLGSIAGAVIGDQYGDAATGALIGAVVGGAIGYGIGKHKEKQLRTRAEVESALRARGEQVPTVPTVEIEQLTATPSPVAPGGVVNLNGRYTALGSNYAPVGTVRLLRKNTELSSSTLNFKNAGETAFSQQIAIPRDAQSGTYVAEFKVKNGSVVDTRTVQFIVT